jgi:Secretion system C-terminal sorting domain/Domain of unknown function (DUF5005)
VEKKKKTLNFIRFLYVLILFFSSIPDVYSQTKSIKDTAFTQYFRRTSGWTAGDATISLALPDGRSLWFFGDSYIDQVTIVNNQQKLPCIFQVRNAVMVQSGKQFMTLLDSSKTGIARTFFKVSDNVASDPVIWPDKGFIYKDTAFIFLARLNSSSEHLDGYLASLVLPSLKLIGLTRIPSIPAGINFGVTILKNKQADSLYIYGVKAGIFIFDAYVARCPINHITGKWDFYTGNGWSSSVTDIKKLPGTNFAVSPQYTIFPYKGKYYLITQQIGYLTCNLGREIYGYQSSSPFGPFINRQLLYTVDDTLYGDYMRTYNAEVHLQFNDSCSFLISYNVNGACKTECNGLVGSIPADSYRPKFVRVPWSILDPALTCSPVTSSGEIIYSKKINVFPNPSSGHVQIKLASIKSPFWLDLINSQGQIIWHKLFQEKTDQISFDIETQGVYFLRMQRREGYLTSKFVVY